MAWKIALLYTDASEEERESRGKVKRRRREKYSESEKKENQRRGDTDMSGQVLTIDLEMGVFSIPLYLNPSITCSSSSQCGTDRSVLPCAPACKRAFSQ